MGLLDDLKKVKLAEGTGLTTRTGIIAGVSVEKLAQYIDENNAMMEVNFSAMEKGGIVPRTGEPVVRLALKRDKRTGEPASFTWYHNGKYVVAGSLKLPTQDELESL